MLIFGVGNIAGKEPLPAKTCGSAAIGAKLGAGEVKHVKSFVGGSIGFRTH